MKLQEIVAAYESKGLLVSVVRVNGSEWPVWVDFDPQAEEPTDREKESVVRFDSEAALRDNLRHQVVTNH